MRITGIRGIRKYFNTLNTKLQEQHVICSKSANFPQISATMKNYLGFRSKEMTSTSSKLSRLTPTKSAKLNAGTDSSADHGDNFNNCFFVEMLEFQTTFKLLVSGCAAPL